MGLLETRFFHWQVKARLAQKPFEIKGRNFDILRGFFRHTEPAVNIRFWAGRLGKGMETGVSGAYLVGEIEFVAIPAYSSGSP